MTLWSQFVLVALIDDCRSDRKRTFPDGRQEASHLPPLRRLCRHPIRQCCNCSRSVEVILSAGSSLQCRCRSGSCPAAWKLPSNKLRRSNCSTSIRESMWLGELTTSDRHCSTYGGIGPLLPVGVRQLMVVLLTVSSVARRRILTRRRLSASAQHQCCIENQCRLRQHVHRHIQPATMEARVWPLYDRDLLSSCPDCG